MIARYQNRISGPLLDRIDMQIHVGALPHSDLLKQADGETSSSIQLRVERAFERQLARQGKANYLLTTKDLDRYCQPDTAAEQLLRAAMIKLNWSARAYHRVLKVARSIADLAGVEQINQSHVAEAIQYRRALLGH
jgi:magnesium chelatase family protein